MTLECKHNATKHQAIQDLTQDIGLVQYPPETRNFAAIVENTDTLQFCLSKPRPERNPQLPFNHQKKLGQPYIQSPFLTAVMPPFSSNLFFIPLNYFP